VGFQTSSALIENNPPRSAPRLSPARRDYTPCGTSFPFNHGLTVAISSVHTHPSRTDFPTSPRRHHSPAENLGCTLEPMTGGRAPPRESIHPSSAYHSLSSLSTPVLYCSTLYTVSHTPLRCDCSRSVKPLSTSPRISFPMHLITLVGLARPLLTPILPAPDPCQFAC
jgi:hypothetical protein